MSTSTEFHPNAPEPSNGLAQVAHSSQKATNRKHNSQPYSRFVSFMKFVLPTLALVVIILIASWPHINSSNLGFHVGVTLMKLTSDENPSMINPRYIGTDADRQPFSITADLARNVANGDKELNLVMPKADITLKDGTWLVLTANDGIYYKGRNKLELEGAVTLYHDSGYEFFTDHASIDLKNGTARSLDPVSGQGPFGKLNAAGFHMVDKGKIIHLLGKSNLVLYSGAKPSLK